MATTKETAEDRLNVVCLHTEEDVALRDDVERHLAVMKRQGLIDFWSTREVFAGKGRKKAIQNAIDQAHLILVIVSSHLLDSDEFYEEHLDRALARQEADEADVIPILMSTCDCTGSRVEPLQSLPRDNRFVDQWENRDEALAKIAIELRNTVESALEEWGVGLEAKTPAIGKKGRRGRITVVISGEAEDFGVEEQDCLRQMVARASGINPKDVIVADIDSGSIRVTLKMPAEAADELYLKRNEADVRVQMYPFQIERIEKTASQLNNSQVEAGKDSLEMDGRWPLEKLGDFSREFINLYSALYGFQQQLSQTAYYKVRKAYEDYSWNDGPQGSSFYESVRKAVDRNHRPVISSISYASPGTMTLQVVVEVSQEARSLVSNLVPREAHAHSVYKSIYKAAAKKGRNLLGYDVTEGVREDLSRAREFSEEDEAFIEQSYSSLAKAMQFERGNRLLELAGSRVAALKILMSLYRRARNLAELQRKNLLSYQLNEDS